MHFSFVFLLLSIGWLSASAEDSLITAQTKTGRKASLVDSAAQKPCTAAECSSHGPMPAVPMVMMICPKGSRGFGGYSTKCERDVKGTCMWSVVPPR